MDLVKNRKFFSCSHFISNALNDIFPSTHESLSKKTVRFSAYTFEEDSDSQRPAARPCKAETRSRSRRALDRPSAGRALSVEHIDRVGVECTRRTLWSSSSSSSRFKDVRENQTKRYTPIIYFQYAYYVLNRTAENKENRLQYYWCVR